MYIKRKLLYCQNIFWLYMTIFTQDLVINCKEIKNAYFELAWIHLEMTLNGIYALLWDQKQGDYTMYHYLHQEVIFLKKRGLEEGHWPVVLKTTKHIKTFITKGLVSFPHLLPSANSPPTPTPLLFCIYPSTSFTYLKVPFDIGLSSYPYNPLVTCMHIIKTNNLLMSICLQYKVYFCYLVYILWTIYYYSSLDNEQK